MTVYEGTMPVSYSRLGWKWDNPERFRFHWDTKAHLRDQLSTGKIDLKTLYSLLWVDESWINTREGETYPPNYMLFKFIWQRYKQVYRKFKPPLLYRLLINKVGIIVLTLIKEDSAYTTRVYGTIEQIFENADEWRVKENRLLLLKDLKDWWEEGDWREYSKVFIRTIFDWIIENYETEPFVRMTVDFWLDNLLANQHNWDYIEGSCNIERWYPRGFGQVNYLVHGRNA